ncbi:MAG: hypothetical protein GKR92_08155 [Gammaproteobacteria bacterium]|nr:MAG: hypothetical protein GKR92_08155 [Gammaproteobacteria bacterium]
MRSNFIPFLIIALISPLEICAEITISNLLDSAISLNESNKYDKDYEFVKESYELANSPQLFYASVVEGSKGNELEAIKYLIAGQIRSTADMKLFTANSESDGKLVGELWELIFYQFGGAGGTVRYRDKEIYEEIFRNINNYSPIINDSYNPGWQFRSSIDTIEYSKEISKSKEHRLLQLHGLVKLMKNDEYYAASMELQEIQERIKRGTKIESDGERSVELVNKMREISGESKLPIPN